jgi:hypothetical protein
MTDRPAGVAETPSPDDATLLLRQAQYEGCWFALVLSLSKDEC